MSRPRPRSTASTGELNRTGAVGVSEFFGSSPAPEPLDTDLATHLWYGTVSAAVVWWRHHPEQSAQEMTARFERIFAVLYPQTAAAGADRP
ncbi:hypothetical protein [Streptomyces sp. NPDC102360]|uniref:hypothetical protein n=1 Tax=Streptomyces sp. NPDC102360 TaxID=3366160 RepID=UPI003827D15F